MAPSLFSKAICEGTPLKLFNHGRSLRDFTYVEDIVDGVVKLSINGKFVNGLSQAIDVLGWVAACNHASGR